MTNVISNVKLFISDVILFYNVRRQHVDYVHDVIFVIVMQ